MIDFLHFTYPNFFTEPLIISAFLFATASISLAWMASEFLSFPPLKAFAKNELRELGVTLVVLLLAIGLTLNGSLFDMVGRGLAPVPATGPPPTCPEWNAATGNFAFGQAGYFLGCYVGYSQWTNYLTLGIAGSEPKGVIVPRLTEAYVGLMKYEIASGFFSTFAISITLPKGLYPGFPVDIEFANLLLGIVMNPVNEANTLLTDIVGGLISAAFAQKMLLTFIESSVPSVILPLGLVMRTFPFTRKTGSTIVAFAFAAYFIYPLSVLVNYRIYQSLENPPCPASLKPAGQTCTQDAECCSGLCTGKCESMIGGMAKYSSSLAFCGTTDMRGSIQAINNTLTADQAKAKTYQEQIDAIEKQISAERGSMTDARLKEMLEQRARLTQLNNQWLAEGMENTFPTPTTIFNLYRQFEWLVRDTANLMVMVSLFIVVEILITLTIYKDFSEMLGGEPRIMGISKLV